MEFTPVIKVQYGDTLRRFNAPLNENGILDLDMLSLKAKIFSLFDLPSGTDVKLTYIDEDGDIVTLVDDDDLRDVMRQQLKFLRITVNTERSGRSCALSSGSSTPMRSPSVQPPIPNVNAVFADAIKSLPLSLDEALLKLSVDLLSKAMCSSPSISDFIEQLAKLRMGQPCMSPVSPARNASPSTVADDTKEANMPPDVPPKSAGDSSSRTNLGADFVAAAPGVRPNSTSDHFPFDLNVDPPVKFIPLNDAEEYRKDNNKVIHGQVGGKPSSSSSSMGPAEKTVVPKWNSPQTMGFAGSSVACPFSGLPLQNEANMPPHMYPLKRGCKPTDVAGGVFHKGIRCDGCGVHPITGPRYKSLVKDDYDLCSICFTVIGHEGHYIRMDRPIACRPMRGFKPFPAQFQQPWVPPTAPPHAFPLRAGVKRGLLPKLDSRFVSDVTIMDGTVMAPSTHFTKIWRMRNNGNFVWALGTRLVWIGGDNFSKNDFVEIEIPPEGVPIDEELDIALDFVAPSSPGRYISYWRMASPSGHKFGQRVWVLIQVVASADGDKTSGAINLNLPPEAMGTALQEANCGVDDFFPATTPPTEPKLILEEQQGKDQEQNFPINDALLVGDGASASAPPESTSSISYPTIDPMDRVEIAASVPPPPSFNKEATEPSENTGADIDVIEQNLLKELAEMGFKQVDLNKEVLRLNSYDLQQSVDDLCDVSDWDPILDELQEMGFCDTEMNKRLLKKNDGSIRRVVMDLLTGERA